jgi:uncharacterized protein
MQLSAPAWSLGQRQALVAALSRTPFGTPFWARSGLTQTLLAVRSPGPRLTLRPESCLTPDDDAVHLHCADAADPAAPMLLLLHGLEGSRLSSYAQTAGWLAHAAGWHFCVMEFRSCGGVLNRAPRAYHSGETTDLDLVVQLLRERHPTSPLCVLGYSLGANVLLKWLGERRTVATLCVRAAAAVSATFDLAVCARQCDLRYGGAIARHFLGTLIPKARQKHAQHPGSFDIAALERCRTFGRFDDVVTAPLHGFRDAAHYYESQSCRQFLPRIAVPTLLISAKDDPLCPVATLPHDEVAASPYLLPQFSDRGGHVGFVEGGSPARPRRWAEAQAMRFFRGVLAGG